MADEARNIQSEFEGLTRAELEERMQSIQTRIAKLNGRRGTVKPEILAKLLAEQNARLDAVNLRIADSAGVPFAAEPAQPEAAVPHVSKPEPVAEPVSAQPEAAVPHVSEPEPVSAPTPPAAPQPEPIPEPKPAPIPAPAISKTEPDFPPMEPSTPLSEARGAMGRRSGDEQRTAPHAEDISLDWRPERPKWIVPAIGAAIAIAVFLGWRFLGSPPAPSPQPASPAATATPVATAAPVAEAPTPMPEAVPAAPVEPEALARGIEVWRRGGMEKAMDAISALRIAAEATPPSFEARARIAEIEVLLGMQLGRDKTGPAKACDDAAAVAAANQEAPSIVRTLATCELFKKHTGSALKGAQQHLSLEGNSPSDAETYLLIGRIRMAERKRDAALEAFDKATALDPHLFEARHLAAAVRADRRDYAGAVEAETAALAIFAESGEGQRKLAEYRAALAREKEKEESDDRFDEYYQAAVRLRNEGRIAEAAASLDQAIAIRASASMLLTKARWLSDSNPTGALEAAKRAAAAGSGEAYYWIGALEQSMGRTASAISAYETYLAGSPGGSYAPEVRSILKNLRP